VAPTPLTMTAQSPQIIAILGLSGSGKTTAVKALRDRGVFCIDNLPTPLISQFIDQCRQPNSRLHQVGLCLEVRSAEDCRDLAAVFGELQSGGLPLDVIYLFADEETLIRRFKETRSTHPLAPHHPLLEDAIAAEASLLVPLRPFATHEIDTSHLSVHDLRHRLTALLPLDHGPQLHVELLSFGFKHGVPYEADTVLDVRFLPNPYFVPTLRDHSGNEEEVARFVLDHVDSQAFLGHLRGLIDFLLPRYRQEGKAYFTLAIGCTGGRHRSVAIVNALASHLRSQGVPFTTRHRDLDR
jgi:UPF0042 nucleotide-binding protein